MIELLTHRTMLMMIALLLLTNGITYAISSSINYKNSCDLLSQVIPDKPRHKTIIGDEKDYSKW
jgi:hypothetical protein